MPARRTRVLVALAVAGCLLVPSGAALVATGVSGGHGGRTVAGILLGLAGLICFRILFWVRRVRLLTEAGLALHGDEDDERGMPHE